MNKNKISRRAFLSYSAFSLFMLCIAGCGSAYASTLLETTNNTVNTGKLSKPLKLIHFSDLHLSDNLSQELLKDTIKNINELEADIICFTGDVITIGKDYIDSISKIFSCLDSKIGTFAVLGNHDYADKSDSKLVQEQYQKAGVKVLINESLKINHNEDKIILSGLDDLYIGHQDFNKTFKPNNKNNLNICLTHNPSNIKKISSFNQDLVLAGHTHGGQIYLPNVLNHFYKNKFDPRFIRGFYRVNNSILNVNRGIGATQSQITINNKTFKIPAKRLFSSPEISVITIT